MTTEAEIPTQYHGLDVLAYRSEWRGADGGFNEGTSVQAVPMTLDVAFAGEAHQIGERYDLVKWDAKTDKLVKAGVDEADGWAYVRIYKVGFAAYADKALVNKAIGSVRTEAAKLKAEREAEVERKKREARGEFQLGTAEDGE